MVILQRVQFISGIKIKTIIQKKSCKNGPVVQNTYFLVYLFNILVMD